MRLLVVVEQTFAITGRGLVIAPVLPVAEARQARLSLEIRRPDGTRQRVEAIAQVPFSNPPPPVPATHLMLLDVVKDAVPAGTEIWTAD